jgi:hypothetical protein
MACFMLQKQDPRVKWFPQVAQGSRCVAACYWLESLDELRHFSFLSFLLFFFLKKNKKNPGFDFVLNYSSYHQAKTDILKKKGPRENGTGLDGTS